MAGDSLAGSQNTLAAKIFEREGRGCQCAETLRSSTSASLRARRFAHAPDNPRGARRRGRDSTRRRRRRSRQRCATRKGLARDLCRGSMATPQVHECAHCGGQSSVTARAILHKTRVPLTGWFRAVYRLSRDEKGISAMQLKKEIGVSDQTTWLLHKLRKATAGRDQGSKLSGLVEADEGYVRRPRTTTGAQWTRGRERIGGGRGAAWPWGRRPRSR